MKSAYPDLIDFPLDIKYRDTVCCRLQDLPFMTTAVWVFAAPIDRKGQRQHWCIRIRAPPALVNILFLESNGKGTFCFQQQTIAKYYNLHHCLGTKWRIISSVTDLKPHKHGNININKTIADISDFIKM